MNQKSITLFESFDEPFKLHNLGTWGLLNGTLIRNIFTPLIESDHNNIYSKFGDLIIKSPHEVLLIIKKNLSFSNGKKIKNSDILWSIKRALRLNALRSHILTNNAFDIILGDNNSIVLKNSHYQTSILDELSTIAYSIFPESSLEDIDIINVNTPNSGAYQISSWTSNSITLESIKKSDPVTKIDILPSTYLRKQSDIFSVYPNAILRTTKSYKDSLKDDSLKFYEIGNLYQYLLPNLKSKSLGENLSILPYIHHKLNRDELCLVINQNCGSNLLGIREFELYPSQNQAPQSHHIRELFNNRSLIKIYGGFSQVGKEHLLSFMMNLFSHSCIEFCLTDQLNEADFLFTGHMFNSNFPLKSLPYFFGEDSLLNVNLSPLIHMKHFMNKYIIPFQSKINANVGIKMFNELNAQNTVILPLFLDKVGYVCKKELNISLFEPKILQDWSKIV